MCGEGFLQDVHYTLRESFFKCVLELGARFALVDLFGETIVKAEEGVESIVTGEIDLDRLKAFRKEFPVLDDADQFKLLVP